MRRMETKPECERMLPILSESVCSVTPQILRVLRNLISNIVTFAKKPNV